MVRPTSSVRPGAYPERMIGILGGYQTDYARNWTKEGADVTAMTAEVVSGTLAAAGVDPEDIGVIHVGNAFG